MNPWKSVEQCSPGEVDLAGRALRRSLVAAELRVLPDAPVRIRAEQVRVEERGGQAGPAVPVRRDAGEDRLELLEECLRVGRDLLVGRRVRVRRRGLEAAGDASARVVDEDALGVRLGPGHIPDVLEAVVGVDVTVREAPGAGLVPVARVELELELAVASRPELRDRRLLERIESGLRVVERAQDGEARREDHLVVDDRALRAVEPEAHGAVAVQGDRVHPRACRDRRQPGSGEVGGHRLGELLVSAGDVEALIRGAEDLEVPGLRLEPEQEHEVERRLIGRVGAVLLVVGGVEQPAEVRLVPARDVLVDPVVERELVERRAGLVEAVPQRRIPGRVNLRLEGGVDGLEVLRRVGVGVVAAVEVIRLGARVRLCGENIRGGETEPLDEVQDRVVVGVDELAAVLGYLSPEVVVAARDERAVGVHPPAQPRRGLVDRRRHAGIGQRQRGAQP